MITYVEEERPNLRPAKVNPFLEFIIPDPHGVGIDADYLCEAPSFRFT